MNVRTTPSTSKLTRFLGFAGSLALAAGVFAGCSSSVSPNNNSNVNTVSDTVPVLITDAPSDQLAAFTLTINSIVLTDAKGNTASILTTPTTVEICHLNGVQAPLVTAKIPEDTYVSATITFSNPQITYVSSSGAAVTATPTLATTSFTFTFPGSGFTVNNTSTSLLVDLLAGQSVAISGTTVTVTPTFVLKPVPPATAVPPMGQNGTGMEMHGAVVSASGTTLVVQPPSGSNITFTTGNSTTYQGVSGLSALTAGELVEVDFTVQSNGCNPQSASPVACTPTLLAQRIELEPTPVGPPVSLLRGPVTAVSSGSFKMVLMQGIGPLVPISATAVSIFTVTTNSSTVFAAAPQFVSLTNLPFTPTFTAANLSAGQSVGVITSSVSGNTAVASNVYLIPQTIGGTVTKIVSGTGYTAYTVTLNSGSAFTALSGASTITVYTTTATAVPVSATGAAPAAIAVGAAVRFNGLIFNIGSGNFAMVAGVCPDGTPGH